MIEVNTVSDWFEAQGWTPLPFQKKTWEAYRKGKRSGFVNAPTGSGKTYALWGGIVQEALNDPPKKDCKLFDPASKGFGGGNSAKHRTNEYPFQYSLESRSSHRRHPRKCPK